jgi:uncharacterized protein (TIGR02231 family)
MSEPQQENDVIRLEAPVREVTVLEDRASVRRKGELTLPAGQHVLCIERVTPLLVDRTLNGRLGSQEGVRLLDLRIRRERTVKKTRPEELESLWAKKAELERQRDVLRHKQQHQQHRKKTAEAALVAWMRSAAFEAGRGEGDSAGWKSGIERLAAAFDDALVQALSLDGQGADLDDELAALDLREAAADEVTSELWGTIEIELAVEKEQTLALEVEYLVPCAAWRPAHRAELKEGAVHWTLLGSVWQHTGEPWTDVLLRLSTERPAAGVELPLLTEDRLRLRPKSEEEKAHVAVEARDEAIETLGGPGHSIRAQAATQAPDLPGVDDGGEARHFSCPSPVSIPSNGLGHFLELASFESDAKTDLISFPELAAQTFIRSRQANRANSPLLAGPVQLIREGVYSGTGRIDFIAPGEPFELGWGSLDDVQVVRKTGQQKEKSSLTGKKRQLAWAEVYLSNFGDTPRTLTVTERIPVSELEEVEIALLEEETTKGYDRDEKGHLRWTVTLQSRQSHKVKLRYRVQSHRSVVWR